MIDNITHISLFVHDQNEALEFYKKLGFKLHTDSKMSDGFRWLTINAPGNPDLEIALLPATTEEQRSLVGNQTANHPYICLSTKDIGALYQDWRRHSVEVVQEPQDMPWGKQALFADLYGNVINVVQS